MLDRLELIKKRYDELTKMISDPDIMQDMDKYKKLLKERSDLEGIALKYEEYKKVVDDINAANELLEETDDIDYKNMLKSEIEQLESDKERLESELKLLLLPKDPNDEKNVIVEIRAGAGGEEAALFAADLYRMYVMYAESKGWKIDVMNSNETDIGGYKEISFMVVGKGAYSRLKYESGVHRVQRVPTTEAGGRIHTSTATVAVLPEAEEVEVEINPNDIRIDVFRSSGHGGQSVNTTDSAVRITHLPTGMVVTCQDEKSQLKNKEKALKVLRARLYEMARREKEEQLASERRSMVGTGDRSERIRTYNFPQGRVTDHRINLTLYRLQSVLDGDLDEIIDALIAEDQKRMVAAEEDAKKTNRS
ncbi:bacterial peptide chain release factor 1 (bRF-1) [Caldanaerobius fijiensis DSM 17918]|uniref:Peptide chain release factor 1 n=1 Tax=Caldanaerobius fijiensis DSM 17918 TaxID=1121256 RepID=A0A1M4X166_9THEO|nr:peptide chain release factor 1 [Caldanaerobius fijiensis]SHE86942.1 bacterial peptide chain release factor 1 (bRF-1) [Caldanaerobius fijiensis DSM 17918]